MNDEMRGRWALILGASSGFGAACGKHLAGLGMNVFGVHLDRMATMGAADQTRRQIEEAGGEALFFNVNAADPGKRAEVLDAVATRLGGSQLGVLLHSLAFGTLLPLLPIDGRQAISQKQLEMTLDVMANSLVYWTAGAAERGLLGRGSRIFAMTSAGTSHCWPSYGAVAAAKACLECHVRHLAVELGPMGTTVNALRAGVTDTPALRKIPGHEAMLEMGKKNPAGRSTTPEDVASLLGALATSAGQWVTGTTIGVDGGENLL